MALLIHMLAPRFSAKPTETTMPLSRAASRISSISGPSAAMAAFW